MNQVAREIPIDQTRNIGIMAHIDAGKTTTTERILFYTGVSRSMGEVHDGTAVMDWMEQEQERGISITAASTTCYWRRHKINLIDTPGHVDFTMEVERCLRVLDGAVALFCAVGGVEAQSETVWRQADKYRVPRLVFINKCDRLGADPWGCVEQLKTRVGAVPILTQIPIGLESEFTGVIDLVSLRALRWTGDTTGAVFLEDDIPATLQADADLARQKMVESLCEVDDEIFALFVQGADISPVVLRRAIRRVTISGAGVPVLLGAAFRNKGVQPLLDAVVDYLPSPLDIPAVVGHDLNGHKVSRVSSDDAPFAALAFKTMCEVDNEPLTFFRVYSGRVTAGSVILNSTKRRKIKISRLLQMHANRRAEISVAECGSIAAAIGIDLAGTGDTLCSPEDPIQLDVISAPQPTCSVSIEANSDNERASLLKALAQLESEDPSFYVKADPETGQTIISGMGELHLEVIVDRLVRQFGVRARVGKPEVAYREIVTRTGEGEGCCQHMVGGRSLFASVRLLVEPSPERSGFIFEDRASHKEIPERFIEAIKSGANTALLRGAIAGYPISDARVVLLGGSHHLLDSNDMAFQIATQAAVAESLQNCAPILLEPIMSLDVSVPSEYVGAVTGNLGARRGRVVRLEGRGTAQAIRAEVPLVSMFGYSTDVRSLTQGRATFTMQFLRFSPVPVAMIEVVAKRNQAFR